MRPRKVFLHLEDSEAFPIASAVLCFFSLRSPVIREPAGQVLSLSVSLDTNRPCDFEQVPFLPWASVFAPVRGRPSPEQTHSPLQGRPASYS